MNKLEQYKNIIKYLVCPVCGNKDMEYETDEQNVIKFRISCRVDVDKTHYSHYFQNIMSDNHYYWWLRYEHNNHVYEIENYYYNNKTNSIFYFSDVGHEVGWSYSSNKDFSNLSKKEVIELIDKAVLLK